MAFSKQLTELFGKAKGTISEHIKHIFKDGELTREATVRFFRTVHYQWVHQISVKSESFTRIQLFGFSEQLDADSIQSKADNTLPTI